MALLVADQLDKRYRRTWALRDVSFELAPGGITALVGPNGAGKSTLLRLCLGFERRTGGRLWVAGIDPAARRAAAVAMLGYVPQAPTLYGELTVDDHVALAATLRPGFDRGYAGERLRRLDIPSAAKAGELSGGQAAQVWLAIALGTRAPLLLLDEPLANLDPLARREFLGVVSEASRAGDTTVLLSSHVISDVEPVADRLLLLASGRVLIHDAIRTVRAAHRAHDSANGSAGAHAASGDLVATFPDRDGHARELRTVAPASAGDPATLEDVVLGYLASARTVPA